MLTSVHFKKKKSQPESCESSFTGGNMRTTVQETAPQIAPRACSKEVLGKDNLYVILVKGEYMQLSTYFSQNVSAGLVTLSASQEK